MSRPPSRRPSPPRPFPCPPRYRVPMAMVSRGGCSWSMVASRWLASARDATQEIDLKGVEGTDPETRIGDEVRAAFEAAPRPCRGQRGGPPPLPVRQPALEADAPKTEPSPPHGQLDRVFETTGSSRPLGDASVAPTDPRGPRICARPAGRRPSVQRPSAPPPPAPGGFSSAQDHHQDQEGPPASRPPAVAAPGTRCGPPYRPAPRPARPMRRGRECPPRPITPSLSRPAPSPASSPSRPSAPPLRSSRPGVLRRGDHRGDHRGVPGPSAQLGARRGGSPQGPGRPRGEGRRRGRQRGGNVQARGSDRLGRWCALGRTVGRHRGPRCRDHPTPARVGRSRRPARGARGARRARPGWRGSDSRYSRGARATTTRSASSGERVDRLAEGAGDAGNDRVSSEILALDGRLGALETRLAETESVGRATPRRLAAAESGLADAQRALASTRSELRHRDEALTALGDPIRGGHRPPGGSGVATGGDRSLRDPLLVRRRRSPRRRESPSRRSRGSGPSSPPS